MNELIRKLIEQAHEQKPVIVMDSVTCEPTHKIGNGGAPMYRSELNPEKFAELIVRECILTIQMGITRDGRDTEKYQRSMKHIRQIKQHFGIQTEPVDERKHIGYTEREEGFYKLYAPPQGAIVTQAFILCKYCSGAIYHCSGPKLDAVCFSCYSVDPELRGQA